jgi:hypothetical protein
MEHSHKSSTDGTGVDWYVVFLVCLVAATLLLSGTGWVPYAVLIVFALLLVVVRRFLLAMSYVSRCIAPILLGFMFVMIYFELHQMKTVFGFNIKSMLGYELQDLLNLAQFNSSYKEQFYTAIATLFAIIVALALVKGIEGVDDLQRTLIEEAYKVRSVWNFLKYFETDELDARSLAARAKLRQELRSYARHIVEGADRAQSRSNDKVLEDCRLAMLELTPVDRDDKIAQKEIIRAFGKLGVLRAKRIGSSGSRLSGYLKAALWSMSLAMLLPFMAEPLCVDPATIKEIGASKAGGLDMLGMPKCDTPLVFNPQRFSQYYMIFIIASFFSFLLLMLHDLSSPDEGFWRVDSSAFKDLLAEFEAELAAEAGMDRRQIADPALARAHFPGAHAPATLPAAR